MDAQTWIALLLLSAGPVARLLAWAAQYGLSSDLRGWRATTTTKTTKTTKSEFGRIGRFGRNREVGDAGEF